MDLVRAVENGNMKLVLDLLRGGADVNFRDEDDPYITPLIAAIEHENIILTKLLLLVGADPNLDTQTFTPLIMAIYKKFDDAVNLLLEYNADVNVMSQDDNTPLIEAVRQGNLNLIKILMERGADMNVEDFEGINAIYASVQNNHLEILKFLHESGGSLYSDDGESIIYVAVSNGGYEIIGYLINNGIDPNEVDDRGFTPIMQAVVNGDLPMFKFLQSKGGDIHMYNGQNGESNLIMASERGYYHIVDYLLEQRSDSAHGDSKGYTSLMYAAENGYENIVRLLLERGNDYTHYSQAYNIAKNNAIKDMIKPYLGLTIKSAIKRH